MPELTVITHDGERKIPFSPGPSLRQILDAAGLRVRSGCRGNGACGLCLVQIDDGIVNEPTRNERVILAPEQVEGNTRLACQVVPDGDLRLRIVNKATSSVWRELRAGQLRCTPPHIPSENHSALIGYGLAVDLGLAIDLGTTHISLSLWDLKNGKRLASRTGLNPQSCFGADVVTRLMAAGESAGNARKIARLPLDAIREALQDLSSRDGISPEKVVKVAIVGNTPMIAMVTESDSQVLLQPNYWTRSIDCKLENPKAWADYMGIDSAAKVEVVSPLAGFVGSDLLAGVLATQLTDRPGALSIDFGTNSEMALWDGNTLWVTSAAGGPAFESCGIRCGMPAEPGAIYHVDWQDSSDKLSYQVLGGGEAKGICGSGLVDVIALLRSKGDLKSTGRFAPATASDGYVVRPESPTICVTTGDVDMLQRAKAAIGVGIATLLARAKMSVADLNRICVCGAFGQDLNVRNAQIIGLLPDAPIERFELCGNSALAGCERLLLSPPDGAPPIAFGGRLGPATSAADLVFVRERATIINLSQLDDFETLFLENLYLQPMRMGGM